MPSTFIALLIIVAIAVVAVWLIEMIPVSGRLAVLKTIAIIIVVFIALTKVLALW